MNQSARGTDFIHVVAKAPDDHNVHAEAARSGLQKTAENSQNIKADKAGGFLTGCHRVAGN